MESWHITLIIGALVFVGLVVTGFMMRATLAKEARNQFESMFKALSHDALRSNQSSFLEMAQAGFQQFHELSRKELEGRKDAIHSLVEPLKSSLERVDQKLQQLEKERAGAYQGLTEQVRGLLDAQHALRKETLQLTNALRSPVTRGRWGEIQLKRVVEIAGMLKHCDFVEQATAQGENGRKRPDLVVKLPGDKKVVVDAKAPLAAYLEAMADQDEDRRTEHLKEHARAVRSHIVQLSQKAYWDQFNPHPEFVVLFLPGEHFFSAACEHDAGLIEMGVEHRVILATPTTLISLLRAVAYGWRQESLADNVREVQKLGRELHGRLADLSGHLDDVGRSLKQSVTAYNKAVGTFSSRVMVSVRRFEELGVEDAKKEVAELNPLEITPRSLSEGGWTPSKPEPPSAPG